MFRYATLNNIAESGLARFHEGFEKTEDVSAAQGILVRSAKMHDMEFSDELLAVARAGAGVNNIPLEACAEKGIVVFNTPGANANGVRVANAAVYMDMEVYGYDPYVSVENAWHLSRKITHVTDIGEIYENCDFITIHVPLIDATRGMIDKDAIARMKEGVILINMARDLLVDEEAVIAAIEEGKIRRYVSDFPNATIAGKKGCITTPHLGASTEESEENCAVMAAEELQEYLENGNIRNSVNYPSCDMGRCQSAARIAILHENKANMITQTAAIMGTEGINIAGMANNSRGRYAYTMADLDSRPTREALEKLRAIDGVFRVREIC